MGVALYAWFDVDTVRTTFDTDLENFYG